MLITLLTADPVDISVKKAASFYKDFLGFSFLGKPDDSHASLVRASQPDAVPISTTKGAPGDSIQLYLRISPMGSDGQRSAPPPQTLWILVADVDKVFEEVTEVWEKYKPKTDQYFPTHSFGDVKILGKPQNKVSSGLPVSDTHLVAPPLTRLALQAWGTRELHIVDGDENKIIFFVELNR